MDEAKQGVEIAIPTLKKFVPTNKAEEPQTEMESKPKCQIRQTATTKNKQERVRNIFREKQEEERRE